MNPVKRQYLKANMFQENFGPHGILRGLHGKAVGLLICDGYKTPHTSHIPLIGSWVGDPVIATGDYARPNSAGICTTTADQPQRNLYGMAQDEFEDISPQAIVMLCEEDPEIIAFLVEGAKPVSGWVRDSFVDLGLIVFLLDYRLLRSALEGLISPQWTKEFMMASLDSDHQDHWHLFWQRRGCPIRDLARFLIAARLFSWRNEQQKRDPLLHGVQTQRMLRRTRAPVPLDRNTAQGVPPATVQFVPDLWLDFHSPFAQQPARALLIEIDQGMEGKEPFKKRIEALLAFVSGPEYPKMFGGGSVTVVFAITAGDENRLRDVLTWIEEVLQERDQSNDADTFRVSRLLPSWEVELDWLFSTPSWYRPFDKRPLPLFS